jgi:nucleotide-binding universal stress UspA family protein
LLNECALQRPDGNSFSSVGFLRAKSSRRGPCSLQQGEPAAAEAEFGQFAARVAEKGIVVDAQELVRGDPVATILRIATEEDVDLIVMGTHGRTGLSHVLLGSITERVLRRTDRPILTVRAPHERKAA